MENILVVDDEVQILELLELVLQTSGYAVHTATRESDAVACMQNQPIDLVVMDVMFGDDDIAGFKIARELKKLKPHVPLVFLTGMTTKNYQEMGLQIGEAYLVKPFQSQVLLQEISKQLKARVL